MKRRLVMLAEWYLARNRREVAYDHEAADAEIVEWLRTRFPDAPADLEDWDSTAPIRPAGDR